MITVHHLNNSRSQRIVWLLEELGIEYELRHYERDKTTMLAPPELRKVHPLGKSPVITDGDITAAESGAIVEYLVDRHGGGRLAPQAGTPERLRYTYWLHYAEGSLMPPLVMKLVLSRVPKAPMPFYAKPIARALSGGAMKTYIDPQIKLHLDYLEAELARTPWFAGNDFSAADIQMSFPIEAALARGGPDGGRPNLAGFVRRIHARPAYQRALERGGKFEVLS